MSWRETDEGLAIPAQAQLLELSLFHRAFFLTLGVPPVGVRAASIQAGDPERCVRWLKAMADWLGAEPFAAPRERVEVRYDWSNQVLTLEAGGLSASAVATFFEPPEPFFHLHAQPHVTIGPPDDPAAALTLWGAALGQTPPMPEHHACEGWLQVPVRRERLVFATTESGFTIHVEPPDPQNLDRWVWCGAQVNATTASAVRRWSGGGPRRKVTHRPTMSYNWAVGKLTLESDRRRAEVYLDLGFRGDLESLYVAQTMMLREKDAGYATDLVALLEGLVPD